MISYDGDDGDDDDDEEDADDDGLLIDSFMGMVAMWTSLPPPSHPTPPPKPGKP